MEFATEREVQENIDGCNGMVIGEREVRLNKMTDKNQGRKPQGIDPKRTSINQCLLYEICMYLFCVSL